MKKTSLTICLLVCAVLAAALLFSIVALSSAKSDAAALQVRIAELEEQNHSMKRQLSTLTGGNDEHYCTLIVDSWSAEDGTLAVSAFAQAALYENADFSARLELWYGTTASSQPVTLGPGEADGFFESDVYASFQIPELTADEELQLWLTVETADGNTLFTNGAGWYLEDGQLMLITG